MDKLKEIQATARKLARSGQSMVGLPSNSSFVSRMAMRRLRSLWRLSGHSPSRILAEARRCGLLPCSATVLTCLRVVRLTGLVRFCGLGANHGWSSIFGRRPNVRRSHHPKPRQLSWSGQAPDDRLRRMHARCVGEFQCFSRSAHAVSDLSRPDSRRDTTAVFGPACESHLTWPTRGRRRRSATT
jgi:hypothetical protein